MRHAAPRDQPALFPQGWNPEHAPVVETEVMRYVIDGKGGPEPRTLSWDRYTCSCRRPSCELGWRR